MAHGSSGWVWGKAQAGLRARPSPVGRLCAGMRPSVNIGLWTGSCAGAGLLSSSGFCPLLMPSNAHAGPSVAALAPAVTPSSILAGLRVFARLDLKSLRLSSAIETAIGRIGRTREAISVLAQRLDLDQGQIRAAFDILREKEIPPERLAATLGEIAERLKAIQVTATVQAGDDFKVTGLKADVQRAIGAGNLARADELLADIERHQTSALDRLAANAAETSAQRGQLAVARLRYPEAAQHFATAASRAARGYPEKHLDYLRQEAGALYQHGREFGDNPAVGSAIERYRDLLAVTPENSHAARVGGDPEQPRKCALDPG